MKSEVKVWPGISQFNHNGNNGKRAPLLFAFITILFFEWVILSNNTTSLLNLMRCSIIIVLWSYDTQLMIYCFHKDDDLEFNYWISRIIYSIKSWTLIQIYKSYQQKNVNNTLFDTSFVGFFEDSSSEKFIWIWNNIIEF